MHSQTESRRGWLFSYVKRNFKSNHIVIPSRHKDESSFYLLILSVKLILLCTSQRLHMLALSGETTTSTFVVCKFHLALIPTLSMRLSLDVIL